MVMEKEVDPRAQSEISRLIYKGWDDLDCESKFLYIPTAKIDRTISFPQEAYDPNETNEVAGSVWAESRANVIFREMDLNGIDLIWEIGAGDGNVAIPLRNKGKTVIAVEPLRTGAESLAKDGFLTYLATLEDLKLPSNSLEAIGMFDVLEHIENPNFVLQEVHRVLKPNGKILITVPAHQFLFSDFDISIGHFKRYSKDSLRKMLIENNFEISRVFHFFFLLVLPAMFLRAIPYRMGRRREYLRTAKANKAQNQILKLASPILRVIFKLESQLPAPMGLSLFAIASKKEVSRD
jgi:2-polyprenyl-3-methyl-5-hydroxy-6-metoxy-1,4-benzoquinol methylase